MRRLVSTIATKIVAVVLTTAILAITFSAVGCGPPTNTASPPASNRMSK